jgi:hypothetical protein
MDCICYKVTHIREMLVDLFEYAIDSRAQLKWRYSTMLQLISFASSSPMLLILIELITNSKGRQMKTSFEYNSNIHFTAYLVFALPPPYSRAQHRRLGSDTKLWVCITHLRSLCVN